MKHNRGFTLIELMVVVVIIAILATIAMSVYGSVNAKTRDAIRLSDFANINQAVQVATHSSQDSKLDLCFNIPAPCSGSSYPLSESTKKTNGSGWIKVSFDKENIANFVDLPLDPVNDDTYNYSYYSDGTSWRIETVLESSTYKGKMQSDSGTNPNKYEVGSKIIEN